MAVLDYVDCAMKLLTSLLAWLLPIRTHAGNMPPVQTVFIVVMENGNWSSIKGSGNAPYINNTLLPMASYCEQYFNPPGLHPSEPNYLWLEAGTNFGITNDDDPAINHQATTRHLVTLLQNAGISWKTSTRRTSAEPRKVKCYRRCEGEDHVISHHCPQLPQPVWLRQMGILCSTDRVTSCN